MTGVLTNKRNWSSQVHMAGDQFGMTCLQKFWFWQFAKLWLLTLTCAIKQFLATQNLPCIVQVRYLALHSTTVQNHSICWSCSVKTEFLHLSQRSYHSNSVFDSWKSNFSLNPCMHDQCKTNARPLHDCMLICSLAGLWSCVNFTDFCWLESSPVMEQQSHQQNIENFPAFHWFS